MFSGEKNSERGKIPDSERSGLTINLSVCGSPAPIYIQQPKTCREQKKPKCAPKGRKRKEFSFPVDRIVYLAERLKLTRLTEEKIQSVALSAVDIKRSRSEDVDREVGKGKGNRSCGFSSPGFDFSLDLSSISNESDECCDDVEETPSDRGESSGEANGSGEDTPLGECECTKCKTDLIHLYVNSVENQKELVKYLRPCRSCEEPCCICPEATFSRAGMSGRQSEQVDSCGSGKVNKAVETEMSLTGFACECESSPCTGRTFRGSEWPESYSRGEEWVCRCRREEVASGESERLRSYTFGLAKAARSARALVRDLELILSALDIDSTAPPWV